LEYRLLDEVKGYPLLYYYENMEKGEVAARFACDYFIKDRVVYEKTFCAIEANIYVLYVLEDKETKVFEQGVAPGQASDGMKLELRRFREDSAEHPLVHVFELTESQDALLHLLSDYLLWLGQEWRKTSVEIDEDRKVYVYYAEPAA
jgi:hypothetical protein